MEIYLSLVELIIYIFCIFFLGLVLGAWLEERALRSKRARFDLCDDCYEKHDCELNWREDR